MESIASSSSRTETAHVKHDGWRLKVVVFISGAVLMGLEMAGSRVLAIHFGSSIYVWGAIISVFLAALSGGYYSGGIIADRRPTFLLLNGLLLFAGCWLLVIPLYANWICRAVLYVSFGERLDPLVATILLFGGPSVLLGMVSPFAVRLAARSLEKIGNLSGRLYALSTVGSIAGTLITAFWLIPSIGVRTLLQALGACLVVLTMVVTPKSRKAIIAVPLAIFVGCMFLLPLVLFRSRSSDADRRIVFEADSAYHHIRVVDHLKWNARFLHFNNQTQSGISLTPPYETRLHYTDAFQLGRIFRPSLERILIIGGGGGLAAQRFVSDDPKVVVDMVEIDPMVVDVGYKFFNLQNSDRIRVHAEDGRRFVRRTADRYDLVVLDAYTIGGQIPFHLTTQEFMREVKAILKPGGLVMANHHTALEGPRSRVLRSEYKTLLSVFPELHVFPLGAAPQNDQDEKYFQSRRSVIMVALTERRPWSHEQIISIADRLAAEGTVKTSNFTGDARQLLTKQIRTEDVPLLIDDYAPVDTMLH